MEVTILHEFNCLKKRHCPYIQILETSFKFKQFEVYQADCAMKITSDSCLFGGYVANEIASSENILDIGAGTGVLSLMVAQKSTAVIDAIEIDPNAANQAQYNFKISKWHKRLNCINLPIQKYSQECRQTYDVIICNPPFHNQKHKSLNLKKRSAWHNSTLSIDDLIKYADLLLKKSGTFYIIVPTIMLPSVTYNCNKRTMFINEIIYLKANPQKQPKLVFCKIQYSKAKQQKTTTLIHQNNNKVTREAALFVSEDYYL